MPAYLRRLTKANRPCSSGVSGGYICQVYVEIEQFFKTVYGKIIISVVRRNFACDTSKLLGFGVVHHCVISLSSISICKSDV
jgi:hypothetical protein